VEKLGEDTPPDDMNTNAQLESVGMFHVCENYRITRPSERFCCIMFATEITILFLLPFIGLLIAKNWAIAVLFLVIAFFSGIRFYFNAAIVLEEVGSLEYVKGETEAIRWKNRARISDIVGNITRGRSKGAWTAVLCVFLLAFLGLLFGAIVTDSDSTSTDDQYQFLPDFYYEQQEDLPYPTCEFGKGLENSPSRALADYAFLSTLAYRTTNITQQQLDGWFGEGVATNHPEVVSAFQEQQTWAADAGASYKLITFDVNGRTDGLVAIRGTTNPWDMLTGTQQSHKRNMLILVHVLSNFVLWYYILDAQLWSAAASFQILRFILPIGYIFTPIFDEMVEAITWLESDSIKRVSFYIETTAFVQSLQKSGNYGGIQVTGHSLGGGLAIITGAQTGAPAVALSGPNSMISRNSFDPPVSVEALNTKTFNIVPNRDPVPMFDDKAQLFQNIECRAPYNGTFRVTDASAKETWSWESCPNARFSYFGRIRLCRLSQQYPVLV
jgi:lipase ATG15